MLIKNTSKGPSESKSSFLGLSKLSLCLLLFGVLLGVLASTLWENSQEVLLAVLDAPSKLDESVSKQIKADIPTIVLDIKHKARMKLLYQREKALSVKAHASGQEEYVKSEISSEGQRVKAKLRLKGTFSDHYQDARKLSYKVKVKGRNAFRGMKYFSLVSVPTRSYVDEWIFSKALKRESLLSTRVAYVYLTVNGEDHGLYLLQEDLGKHLLENQGRREGPILTFSKDLWLGEWNRAEVIGDFASSKAKDPRDVLERTEGDFNARALKTLHMKSVLENPRQKELALSAMASLEQFRSGKKTVSQTFDLGKLTKFLALRALLGSREFDPNDTAFYFNPINGLLEPIGSEVNTSILQSEERVGAWWLNDPTYTDRYIRRDFLNLFFKDKEFWSSYLSALGRIARPEYLKLFLEEIKGELTKHIATISAEYPKFHFREGKFDRNQAYIKEVLSPIKGVHAFFEKRSANKISLLVGNLLSVPIEVVSVEDESGLLFSCLNSLVLQPRSRRAVPEYVQFECSSEVLPATSSVASPQKLKFKLLGQDSQLSVDIFPWSHISKMTPDADFLRAEATSDAFGFVEKNEETKEIIISPGVWRVSSDLIFPKGYLVRASAGTELILENNSILLSRSRLLFNGSAENPIKISSQGSGSLFVHEVVKPSSFSHVIISGLSAPKRNSWQLSGAVTFYKAAISLNNVVLKDMQSEDALNVVNTEFSISNSYFSNVLSDAFDSDFSSGVLRNTRFSNLGNDAIDFSGSDALLEKIKIEGAVEKAISVGEASRVSMHDVIIQGADIGIASKDSSFVEASELVFSKLRVGAAVFQKKPQYGPAEMKLSSFEAQDVEILLIRDTKSRFAVDSDTKVIVDKNIYKKLYTQAAESSANSVEQK